jgi:hypothetical protein
MKLRTGDSGGALLNTTMNFRTTKKVGDLLTERLSASQQGLRSMELRS